MTKIETILEPERKTPVAAKVDVTVCGGGPAGCAAALSAARKGARVILLEQYGFLGGMTTAGGVNVIMPTRTVKGIYQEIADKLKELGAVHPIVPIKEMLRYFRGTGESIRKYTDTLFREGTITEMLKGTSLQFHPETLKWTLQDMAIKEGVMLRFHTFVSDVFMEKNKVCGVIVQSKSGRQAIKSKIVIDATGDGDVAVLSGAPYTKGRRKDGGMQPMTLMFSMQKTDRDSHPVLPEGCKKYKKASDLPRDRIVASMTPGGRLVVNMTRMHGDGTKVEDLTKAEIEGLKQALSLAHFLQNHGFGRYKLTGVAPQVGVRETRQITGDYVLTGKDLTEGRKFDDVVAVNDYYMEIQSPDGKGSEMRAVKPYHIPYRCLVPKKVENLLVAGRCISATHEAMSSLRIIPVCMATGQAAGTAAALAVKNKQSPRQINVKLLQDTLREDGAFLG
jgi:ribulose 1,5-bisphosphate synthetase/thiazole synthase